MTADQRLAHKRSLAAALGAKVIFLKYNKLANYRPYSKQKEFHAAGIDYAERCLAAGNQTGKAVKNGTLIATPTGFVPIESVQIGDEAIGGDGQICSITGVYPQGIKQLYRLTFDNDEQIVCCEEHLWKYQAPAWRYPTRHSHGKEEPNPGYGRWDVASLGEIIAQHGKAQKTPRRRILIPVCEAWDLPERQVPLDPYTLGVLLGDGSLCTSPRSSLSITNADPEIIERLRLPAGVELRCTPDRPTCYRLSRTDLSKRNPLQVMLEELGLLGKMSADKFVPAPYLWGSVQQRLDLLHGLMDTDGSISGVSETNCGGVEFSTVSEHLRDAVLSLCYSLGGKAHVQRVDAPRYTYKGEERRGQAAYRVRLKLKTNPFSLSRKRDLWRASSLTPHHVLRRIEKTGASLATCISVDSGDQTFVTEYGIVTHNTTAGSMEIAYHATGRYPEDWDGMRFDRAAVMWVGGITSETIRDTTQKLLVGRIQDPSGLGSGSIPRDAIMEIARARGLRDTLDHVKVYHVSGATTLIFFKSYEKGREKWQGESIDLVWFDEEPPMDIYAEGKTRTNKGQNGQCTMLTYTPLLGMTEISHGFYQDPTPAQHLTVMTIDDVDHYTDEEKEQIVSGYLEYEREARARGIPILGSGRVFPVPEEYIVIEPFEIPAHFYRLIGCDFGWDHPQGWVNLAWDQDRDVIYVIDEYRRKETTPDEAAVAIRRWHVGEDRWPIPVAWPHDGYQHDKGSGLQLAEQYRSAGLEMLRDHATHPEGGFGTEAGVMDMLDRMKGTQFKVFNTCQLWLEEFRLYHRKEGKIIKERDDLMSATRMGVMMLRYAEQPPSWRLDRVEGFDAMGQPLNTWSTRNVGPLGY